MADVSAITAAAERLRAWGDIDIARRCEEALAALVASPPGTQTRAPNAQERERFETQCDRILNLLIARGDAGVWSEEMADIALKYTSRISELRGCGFPIRVVEHDTLTGRRRYVMLPRAPLPPFPPPPPPRE